MQHAETHCVFHCTPMQDQYWTEAQRLASEDKAFWLERVALVYTIIVAIWLEQPCPEVGELQCLLTPRHWLFPLILALGITTFFYLCELFYSMAGHSLELLMQPLKLPWIEWIKVSWIERILFWVERSLIVASFVMVPKGSIVYYLSVMLYDVSLLATMMYLASFLDRMSLLRWFLEDNYIYNHDIDEDEKENEKGSHLHISDECMRNIKREHCCGQCEKSCETLLVNWEAKFEKLQDEWFRSMNGAMIEPEKKMKRAEDEHKEERRKWEEEKVHLTAKLSAAIASSELYRSLLHDSGFFLGDLTSSAR